MRKTKSKAKWIIGFLAVVTLLVGAALAIGAYLKKNAAFLSETLDYDDDLFFEDDEYVDNSAQQAPKEDIIESAFEPEDDLLIR